jgi:hypothetical protein
MMRALAAEFARRIRLELGADNLARVVATNKRRNDATCATHDYIDSNQTMIDAFSAAIGRPLRVESGADLSLINQAWTRAKLSHFEVSP